MQHPDEGTIHAWLDGALSTEESAALESHVAACADCSTAVAEARGLVAASSRIVSALDVVPGGVIPARKPVSRPWYTSTQLRAAAAVLFIAGTSAILYRSRGEESLPDLSQRVMSDQALPVPAQAESDAAVPEQTAAAGAAANAAAPRETRSSRQKEDGARTSGGAVGAVAEAAQSATDVVQPPAAPAPAAMIAAAPPVAAMQDTMAAAKVAAAPIVVTGVTTNELSADLRILSVDSSTSARITRYRIASGAELTLTETSAADFVRKDLASGEGRLEAVGPAAPPAPQLRRAAAATAVSQVPVQSITWTDTRTQRTYTLIGRVSKETLEEVREKIQRKP